MKTMALTLCLVILLVVLYGIVCFIADKPWGGGDLSSKEKRP